MRLIHRWGALALAGALITGVSACDSLLDVEDPDIVLPDNLNSPEGLAALRAGAFGDFALAYSAGSGNDNQIMATGLFTDEYRHSGTFQTRAEMDRRDINVSNGGVEGLFDDISRARQGTESAARRLIEAAEGEADSRIGEMWGLAGYTYVFFGETFCSGVPVSELVDGAIVPGVPLTTTELFERAIERFDESLASNDGDAALENMARIGKARALLNLDRAAEAAAEVAGVDTDFEFTIQHSINSGRQENAEHDLNIVVERWTLADNEGGNGLNFRSAMDPRVPWERNPADDVGFDSETPQFDLLKYPARTTPVVLAGGYEARYIEAEAALRASQFGTFMDRLNEVRDSIGGLTALTDPGTQAGREDLLFRERAFTMFATGHRLGDIRRLVRQYGRSADEWLPSGAYPKGSTYGSDVNFPVPEQEENNENFTACLDREA